jgi:hypothetical protein
VTELLGVVALVAGLDDHSLATSEAASKHNNNLSVLEAER